MEVAAAVAAGRRRRQGGSCRSGLLSAGSDADCIRTAWQASAPAQLTNLESFSFSQEVVLYCTWVGLSGLPCNRRAFPFSPAPATPSAPKDTSWCSKRSRDGSNGGVSEPRDLLWHQLRAHHAVQAAGMCLHWRIPPCGGCTAYSLLWAPPAGGGALAGRSPSAQTYVENHLYMQRQAPRWQT